MKGAPEGRNNSLIVWIVVGILVVLGIAIYLNYNSGVRFSPDELTSISEYMEDVRSNPDGYRVVIDESATGAEIVSAGEFAGAFGLVSDVEIWNERSSGDYVYFLIDSDLLEDYQIGVSQEGNILAVVARDVSLLDDAVESLKNFDTNIDFMEVGVRFVEGIGSVLSCDDGTEIGDCSLDKPKVCEITNVARSGLSLGFSNSCSLCGCDAGLECNSLDNLCVVPTPLGPFADIEIISPDSLVEGEKGEVVISVTPSRDVKGVTVGVDASDQASVLFSDADPSAGIAFDDQIVWVGSSSQVSSEGTSVEYRFKVKSSGVGELTIAGRASAEGLSSDESVPFSISVNIEAAPCVESWSCGEFSPASCPVSGERTRVCSDVNACGSENDKPVEFESCIYQPRCVESGDNGLDIFVAGNVSFDGSYSIDSCVLGLANDSACTDDNTLVESSFRCDVCNSAGTACVQERLCVVGDVQEFNCPDGSLISDYYVCNINGNGYERSTGVECPPEQAPMNDLFNSLIDDSAVSPVGIIGSAASRTDNQGLIGIAGRFGISDIRLDSEGGIENIGGPVILVGGPCVNSAVADLQSEGKFPFACSGVNGWPGGGNFRMAHHIKNAFGDGNDAVVVAGTRAEDTLALARQVRDFSSNSELFKGVGMVCEDASGSVCTSIVQN